VIEHSLIDHNLATSSDATRLGGGIYSWSYSAGALMIRDSTIAYNGAEAGGGVAVEYYGQTPMSATAVLERVTLARNATTQLPGGLALGQGASVLVNGSILAENVYDPPQVAGRRAAAAPQPSNCDPQLRPIDGGGNLSDTDDCGFKNPPADPQLSDDLDGSLGETPLLTISPESPAVDLAGNCQDARYLGLRS
jgi:hypothetical protein